jgi:hypothetical protein
MRGQNLTASQRGYSWHETGETGKLPDVGILGSPAISREEHVRRLMLSGSVIRTMTDINTEYGSCAPLVWGQALFCPWERSVFGIDGCCMVIRCVDMLHGRCLSSVSVPGNKLTRGLVRLDQQVRSMKLNMFFVICLLVPE